MLHLQPFTTVTGGALGVDLEAEKLARDHGLAVYILIPPCHPISKSLRPLSRAELAEAIRATLKAAFCLNKELESLISVQYVHRNYHVVKKSDLTLALGRFQATSNMIHGRTVWAVEFAKLMKKILYVYDQIYMWFWYRHDQDLFCSSDQV